MNIFINILLQIILISYPFIFYLFYNSYTVKHDEKIKNILIDMSLFLSIYLFFIYSNTIKDDYYLMINIPIVIAYSLNKKNIGLLLSMFILYFYYIKFDFNIVYGIIEYIMYYVIYLVCSHYKIKNYIIFIISLIIKIIFTYLLLNVVLYEFLFECILFCITTVFINMLVKIGDKLIKYSLNLKEIEKEKQIRDMIFKITHEIKNPIAVCKGYLDMIDVNNKEKTIKYVNNIKGEIDKTLILLQDFLSLRKIQINKDIIDINLLLEENLDVLLNYAKSKNVDLSYNLFEDEVYIDGDYNRLGQVIINIVKNSIEAVNKKNGFVKVNIDVDKDYAYINFYDNGKGMSKDNINKIKEGGYTSKNKGNGIGILLSNEIVSAHMGELIYDSKVGEGTTTILKLPLYKFS